MIQGPQPARRAWAGSCGCRRRFHGDAAAVALLAGRPGHAWSLRHLLPLRGDRAVLRRRLRRRRRHRRVRADRGRQVPVLRPARPRVPDLPVERRPVVLPHAVGPAPRVPGRRALAHALPEGALRAVESRQLAGPGAELHREGPRVPLEGELQRQARESRARRHRSPGRERGPEAELVPEAHGLGGQQRLRDDARLRREVARAEGRGPPGLQGHDRRLQHGVHDHHHRPGRHR